MRAGFTVSIIGHAVILGLGLVVLGTKPLESEKIDALPVDLVSVDEATDLLKGDKSSRVLPEEKPQPKPTVEAETPTPQPEEKPAEKVVEAAPAPAPPPPPPAPEPDVVPPEPETEVAALPEPAPEPAPQPEATAEPAPVPVNPNIPRPRPNPPKQVVEPKPEPKPDVAQQAPQQQFNPDDITALLNKQEPRGGGDPEPAKEPQTLGSIEGHADAAMTQSEIAALKARLYHCWNPPVGVREAGGLVVEVRISLLPDGNLAAPPELLRIEQAANPLSQIAAEAAVRAVVQCAPFGDILRPEKYAIWKDIDFVFDPREMLGG
jgi:hypothetical protein